MALPLAALWKLFSGNDRDKVSFNRDRNSLTSDFSKNADCGDVEGTLLYA